MRHAVESRSPSPEEIFVQTQLAGLNSSAQDVQIWNAENSACLFGNFKLAAQFQYSTEIRFEDERVGHLKSRNALPPNLQLEALASFLYWSRASFNSKLHCLFLLQEICNLSDTFNWVGIYRLSESNPRELIVSTFIGEPTPHRRISIDHGICGAAIRDRATLNIANVKEDSRYLSCSITTKSELVVPLRNSSGEVVAELDIDCTQLDGFSGAMENHIHRICERIERIPDLF